MQGQGGALPPAYSENASSSQSTSDTKSANGPDSQWGDFKAADGSNRMSTSTATQPGTPSQHSTTPSDHPSGDKGKKKQGFFDKIKDKAIGTKEEREAEKVRAIVISRGAYNNPAGLL